MRQALQIALNALQAVNNCSDMNGEFYTEIFRIEEALKQEPVAWMDKDQEYFSWQNTTYFTIPLYKGTP